MKLPERRILSRREALPDPIPPTDRATVAAAAATLANPYLLRQVPTGWLVTGLQVGEQGLMAATAQTLLRLNDKVFAGANPKPELLTLTACLVAPAVIRAARAPLEILWASTVRDSYDAAFVAQSFNRPSTWVMGKGEADFSGKKEGGNVRAERTELYAGNLRWHAQNQVQATVELQGVALAAAANLAIFSTNLGVVMGLAQATALALAMAYGRRAFAEISTNAQAQTAASNALGAHKRRFWDNKTLGNVNNAQRWQERYDAYAREEDAQSAQTARDNAARDLKLAAWVTGPILLGLVIALAQQSLASPSALGRQNLQALLLQGPALMAATQNIIAVSETYWNRYSKRQEELERTLAKSLVTPQLDLAAHCDKSAIVLHHGGVAQTLEAGWSNLVEQALAGQPGRCTFTADNGAGKSMALLQLTEILGPDRSFLLPADHQDLSFNIPKGSTGQRDVAAIEAALSSGAQVVLLDEWDAHLDDANRAMLSDRINHLTRPKAEGGMGLLVVEISHRHKESG